MTSPFARARGTLPVKKMDDGGSGGVIDLTLDDSDDYDSDRLILLSSSGESLPSSDEESASGWLKSNSN